MAWPINRWLIALGSSAVAFIGLSLVSEFFSNLFDSQNPFAALSYAIPFALLSGLYIATYIKDSSYFPDSRPHKWFGIATTLAVIHFNTALIGFVLMVWTVRGRILSESACSLPTPNK